MHHQNGNCNGVHSIVAKVFDYNPKLFNKLHRAHFSCGSYNMLHIHSYKWLLLNNPFAFTLAGYKSTKKFKSIHYTRYTEIPFASNTFECISFAHYCWYVNILLITKHLPKCPGLMNATLIARNDMQWITYIKNVNHFENRWFGCIFQGISYG